MSIINNVALAGNILLVNPQEDQGIKAQVKTSLASSLLSAAASAILPIPRSSPVFLFHIKAEESITLSSDITDHYVEDNSSRQDQIALKPEMITTNGFIGELNDIAPPAIRLLKTAADKLTVLDPFVPHLASSALRAYNTAAQTYATAELAVNASISVFESITGGNVQNKQQVAFNKLYNYWLDRTLFTVQTPWNIMKDMAIQSLRAVQGDDTRMITEIEITFKKINVVDTSSVGSLAIAAARAAAKAAGITEKGSTIPTPSGDLNSKVSA